jgi:hypothetical protein
LHFSIHCFQLFVHNIIIFIFILDMCFQDFCSFFRSCYPKGFKFCFPFLVCNLLRVCHRSVSIFLFYVMVFVVCISGCVLLRLLLWRHREFSCRLRPRRAPMLGIQKSDWSPEHK